ncbi:MAG: hypothetical protein AMXMBFR48_15750 [Ignavibacteriales bacterium]
MKKKILFICGSVNQTTMMHKISQNLEAHDLYFTPYYADGFIGFLVKAGFLKFTILAGKFFESTVEYLRKNNLQIDYKGKLNDYDLIFTCSDLIVQKNLKGKKVILVQEGMTDPENFMYYLVKLTGLPRFLASTSTTGLSGCYDSFCVASEGYKELFIKKGAPADKISVTGIPNFDNCVQYTKNDFPLRDYVLVATSDARETFKYENRKKFIQNAIKIAAGRQIIFKLHPNENVLRATKEIKALIPDAIVYDKADTNTLIANCDVLITKFSSVVYVGISLGKEVHSWFNLDELYKLAPLQNNGTSAVHIAQVAEELLQVSSKESELEELEKSSSFKLILKQINKTLAGV